MMKTRKCECCGITFEGSKKFCSTVCERQHKAEGKPRHGQRVVRVNSVTYRVVGNKKIRHEETNLVPAHTDFSTSAWIYDKGWADKDKWNWWVAFPKSKDTFGPTDFNTAKRVALGVSRGKTVDKALLGL